MKHTYEKKVNPRGMTGRCVCALALALVMLLLASCSTPTNPTISVGSVEAKAGETVEVTVSIQDNPGIMAFIFGFEYDTERLLLVNATVLSEFGEDSEYDRRLVWVGSRDTTYNGAFVALTFQVLADAAPGDATVSVVFEDGDVCNYDEEDVALSVISGKVTVTA